MSRLNSLVVLILDEQHYALHLSVVERIIRVVEITPLPKAPEIVLGVINVRGRIIPVVNLRRRFGLPDQELSLSDQLIIAHTLRCGVALVVDAVSGIVERPDHEVVSTDNVVPGIEYVQGIMRLDDGLIMIHDLDTFLSLEEEAALDEALRNTGGDQP
jgi:purine-binding chemotaxis protein CheW